MHAQDGGGYMDADEAKAMIKGLQKIAEEAHRERFAVEQSATRARQVSGPAWCTAQRVLPDTSTHWKGRLVLCARSLRSSLTPATCGPSCPYGAQLANQKASVSTAPLPENETKHADASVKPPSPKPEAPPTSPMQRAGARPAIAKKASSARSAPSPRSQAAQAMASTIRGMLSPSTGLRTLFATDEERAHAERLQTAMTVLGERVRADDGRRALAMWHTRAEEGRALANVVRRWRSPFLTAGWTAWVSHVQRQREIQQRYEHAVSSLALHRQLYAYRIVQQALEEWRQQAGVPESRGTTNPCGLLAQMLVEWLKPPGKARR